MKTIKKTLPLLAVLIMATSCGVHNAMFTNVNNNVTNVELSESNYRIVEKVTGEATATYIFGIGGLSKKTLTENAKSNMFNTADLEGKSRAITNIVTETYYKSITPLYVERTVTVTGYLIEFE